MTIELLDFVKKIENAKLVAMKLRIKIVKDDGKILDVWNPLDDATLVVVDKDGLTSQVVQNTAVSMLFNDYNAQLATGTIIKASPQDLAAIIIDANTVSQDFNNLTNSLGI